MQFPTCLVYANVSAKTGYLGLQFKTQFTWSAIKKLHRTAIEKTGYLKNQLRRDHFRLNFHGSQLLINSHKLKYEVTRNSLLILYIY